MTSSFSSLLLPLAPLAYSAEFHVYGQGYRLETAPLLESGLCFVSKSVGLEMCFPTDGSVYLDLTDRTKRRYVKPDSFLSDLSEGPIRISPGLSPGQAQFFLTTPLDQSWKVHWFPGFQWVSVLETEVTPQEDAHREILRRAVVQILEKNPHFEEEMTGFESDPAPFETMALGNAHRDHPPSPLATIVDYVLRIFDPRLGTTHHGLAAAVFDDEKDPPRLQTADESNQAIRGAVEQHLVELSRLRDQLELMNSKGSPILMDEKPILDFLEELRVVRKALEEDRFDDVQSWIKSHQGMGGYPVMKDVDFRDWDQETAYLGTVSERLDEYYNIDLFKSASPIPVGSMEMEFEEYSRDFQRLQEAIKAKRTSEVESLLRNRSQLSIYFLAMPGNFPKKRVLEYLLRRYAALEDNFQQALSAFHYAGTLESEGSLASEAAVCSEAAYYFNEGVKFYKEAIGYLSEELWDKMAQGRGPAMAVRQLHREALLHLASDAIGAHCEGYVNDVCYQRVSTNYYGVEPLHGSTADDLLDEYGREKSQNQKAVRASVDLLLYQHRSLSPEEAAEERARILDHYWPVLSPVVEPPDGGVPLPGGVDAPDAGI